MDASNDIKEALQPPWAGIRANAKSVDEKPAIHRRRHRTLQGREIGHARLRR